jgi:hypothetical protein
MGKYSDYNIIPIGDHCAIAMILQQLNLRHKSYPFDWVTRQDHLYSTNIIDNIQLITELNLSDNVDDIVKKYIGDAFDNDKKINSINNIWFPHDNENTTDNFEKYNVKNDEGDVYVVSHNTSENKWRCNCMGFWRLKNKDEGCKHIKEIKGELGL